MTSTVPEGHPGDLVWRLPVWRTLMQLRLVTADQLEPVNTLARQGGFFFSHLVTLGVNPDKLLTAIAVVTGLPGAARAEVRRPSRELAAGLNAELCRAALAVPFAREGEVLHLAFVAPVSRETLATFPPHKAFIALESDVRDGLDALFPKRRMSREAAVEAPVVAAPAAPAEQPAPEPDPPAAFDDSLEGFAPPPPSAPPPLSSDATGVIPPPSFSDATGVIAPPVSSDATGVIPPPKLATDLAAPAPGLEDTLHAARPSAPRPKSAGPSADDLKAVGAVEILVDPREELLQKLKPLKWPVIGLVVLLVVVKFLSSLIDFSRAEGEKTAAQLRQGIGLASVEAARAQQRAMQPGGGGVEDAPLPILTPAGRPGQLPQAGSFDAVSSAMADVDVLARRADIVAFHSACLTLSKELKAFAPMAPMRKQIGPLNNLSTETMILCEQEYQAPPLDGWLRLREQIMTVLKGD